jgi:glycine cleavage system H protein
MSIPKDLVYARSHEWVRKEGDNATIGISDYAQEQLGEVVYVELPGVGDSFSVGDELGTLESVKAVAEFVAPVAGEVVEVNEQLADEPNLVNEDPYGDGWLVKIAASDFQELLSPEDYEKHLAEESH